jgi:phospholipid/cholesterol/gamma-HCH transport system substrate-binding protein
MLLPSTAIRRNRRRSEREPAVRALLKAVATLAVIGLFVAFAVTVQEGVPGRDYSTLYVEAPETGSLRMNDKVAIGGVRVGRVVTLEPAVDRVRVQLQLEPGVELPEDSTFRIRANGLLGARYVQLIPGSSEKMLADGATLRGGRDALSLTVPAALDVLDAETRGALGEAVSQLGEGLTGNGDRLNRAVEAASDAVEPFRGLVGAVAGRGQPERLLPALDRLVGALDDARRDLAAMLDPGADTFDAIAQEEDHLHEALEQAPGSLAAATTGLEHGRRLVAAAASLARAANSTLPPAPAGLEQASALLREAHTARGGGRSPLARAAALLEEVDPTVPRALELTRALDPVLPRLDDAVRPLRPIVRHVGRYGCDIKNAAVTLRSMTGFVGTGTGPNGPSSQFRLQVAVSLEAAGVKELVPIRDAYFEPCTYLGRHHNVLPGTGILGGGR